MSVAIWWLRRDLRLDDNPALGAALNHGKQILPVWILDPALLDSPYVGEKRLSFLWAGLRALDHDLRERGSRLVVRRGDPATELRRLQTESGADAVFAVEDYSPYAYRRDQRVRQMVPLQVAGSTAIHPPGTITKQDGDPYVVYSPFMRSWKALRPPEEEDLLSAPDKIETPVDIASVEIPGKPARPEDNPFPAGPAAARARLAAFLEQDIYQYDTGRNQLDIAGTSRLSPYLRFGMLSPRRAAAATGRAWASAADKQARKSAETFLNELIWRDFYIHILAHFPHVRSSSFRRKYDDLAWENNEDQFTAWCTGETGYPVVDAAMRQLRAQGWMHNRARMIVASFLTKDLLIDWRWGERWFMQHLVDGDPAANNGGWQWAAGTGTDAAPYFRIFNPVSQGRKHDPDGEFVRRWLPELQAVPDNFIHNPWEMPADTQAGAGCIIGEDYPAPIVDHREARERTLSAYKAVV
jgi:deoxyribodipyrimidine photo-lyase